MNITQGKAEQGRAGQGRQGCGDVVMLFGACGDDDNESIRARARTSVCISVAMLLSGRGEDLQTAEWLPVPSLQIYPLSALHFLPLQPSSLKASKQ